jgi:rhamnogalacturonyl hydrolase YesR
MFHDFRADFVYMAPPFMAYMGAETQNITLLEDSLNQVLAYHEVLNAPMRNTTPPQNLWLHMIGPQSAVADFYHPFFQGTK